MARTAGAIAVVNYIRISDAAKPRAEANLGKPPGPDQMRRRPKRDQLQSSGASVLPEDAGIEKIAPSQAKTATIASVKL
jgi:hypothetical protein